MLEINKIYNEDCLVGMQRIEDGFIDCIICDLPFGTTDCKWDSVIDFTKLWAQYKRIIKPNGAIVLFGQEPFSSYLRTSNIEMYRYDWYWVKKKFANFAQAPYMPLKTIETISVFSKGTIASNSKNKMVYYLQGLEDCFLKQKGKSGNSAFRPNRKDQKDYLQTKTNYPKCVLSFD